MHTAAEASPQQETIDLAALGRSYPAPHMADTSSEVSDVIARMPSWATRGLLYLIAGFVVVAFLWAALSKVDIVAQSRATLVHEGYVKPVQAAGGGTVQNIFVREGQTVVRGQVMAELDATEMRTRLNKLREELESSEFQLRQFMVTRPLAETLDQQNRIARLQSEIASAQMALRHTAIKAPVDGTITTLDVRNAGTVIQPGQVIANIAPAGARLLVEAQVLNKDIAFVEKGSPAKLRFDAFPYQDYGIVEGTVIEISPDARTGKEFESFYKVMIVPLQTQISARGKNVPLRSGLTLTAEIITDRKSILSLILEPFRKLKSD